jgi:hypothetical protein
MPESRFLCLAVSRRDGGNCIAGIDIDSGKWIRPINAKTHGAFADHEIIVADVGRKRRILTLLDVMQNWEMAPASYEDAYTVLRRFDGRQDADMLISHLGQDGPLLHNYGNRIPADDLFVSKLSHSLTIIKPEQLFWKVGPHPRYPDKLRVEAEFRFDDDPYCISVTDPIWEARCRRSGPGRHPHSTIAVDRSEQVLLTVSLAEVPLYGYHYKLVAGVVNLPA